MNRNESALPALFWLWMWYSLGQYMDVGVAFLVSIVYWLIARFAFRMCGRVVFRHGGRGWFLLAQLAGWFALFFIFAPIAGDAKFLLIWGIGIPLVFIGGIARSLCDRSPPCRTAFERALRPEVLGLLIVPPLCVWVDGGAFWAMLALTIGSAALSAVPLFYGWVLAEQPARGDHDAHFGSEEDYRTKGMWGER